MLDNCNNFYDPRIKTRNLERVREKGRFSFYAKDLLDADALDGLFRDERPEAIIHLAAYAGVRPSLADPVLYDQVNVTGTSALLEKCRRYEVERFVFGSSSSVYGVNSKVPFHEDDPISQPISPYAVTKRAGELLCFSHHYIYGLPISCLRFFTVYGPRQRPEMAIHKFTRQIHRGNRSRSITRGSPSGTTPLSMISLPGSWPRSTVPKGFRFSTLGTVGPYPCFA